MKVLLQEWMTEVGHKMSISKDVTQLEETIKALKVDDRAQAEGKALEVEIPNNHGLAELVEGDTIFLEKDEEDLIEYPH